MNPFPLVMCKLCALEVARKGLEGLRCLCFSAVPGHDITALLCPILVHAYCLEMLPRAPEANAFTWPDFGYAPHAGGWRQEVPNC